MPFAALPLRSRIKYSLNGLLSRSTEPRVTDNTFFVWEPCSHSHAEVVPGYVHYLLELGFDVSVLLSPARLEEGLFERFQHPRLLLNRMPQAAIVRHFARHGLGRARGVLITTARKIGHEDSYSSEYGLFADRQPGQRILLVEHDIKVPLQRGFLDANVITLRPIRHGGAATRGVNPHFFGDVRTGPRGMPVSRFIVVGALRSRSRNIAALLDAVGTLHRAGRRDFHVTFVGDGDLRSVPGELRAYFTVTGRVSFSELYTQMERADFILSLLDPHNPDHDFYALTGTSGHFQLVYGFTKPCIVTRKFAEPHRLTTENGIIYEDNSQLATAMRTALDMDAGRYVQMQAALGGLSAAIRRESLAALGELLDRG
jgi:hypothetical protein